MWTFSSVSWELNWLNPESWLVATLIILRHTNIHMHDGVHLIQLPSSGKVAELTPSVIPDPFSILKCVCVCVCVCFSGSPTPLTHTVPN